MQISNCTQDPFSHCVTKFVIPLLTNIKYELCIFVSICCHIAYVEPLVFVDHALMRDMHIHSGRRDNALGIQTDQLHLITTI
jgi:hypothetical protein